MNGNESNVDQQLVKDFGQEWKHYDQAQLANDESQLLFDAYFKLFPKNVFKQNCIGADFGCGSGRWAKFVAPHVHKLYCIDASDDALSVAKRNLFNHTNVEFIHSSVNAAPLQNDSLDFAYSLGVLHHIPDTSAGIKGCVDKLKTGAPLLVYLYYAFDNKPWWFRGVWKVSDYFRKGISKLPFRIKLLITQLIAAFIYYPLARGSRLLELCKINVNHFPLAAYRQRSFYSMRTDALDRFGTRLEHRFTREEICKMFKDAGLTNITVSSEFPFWCAVGYKK